MVDILICNIDDKTAKELKKKAKAAEVGEFTGGEALRARPSRRRKKLGRRSIASAPRSAKCPPTPQLTSAKTVITDDPVVVDASVVAQWCLDQQVL